MKKSVVSRLTTNIGRIGGFERNFGHGLSKLEKFLAEYPKVLKEFENPLQGMIFMERTIGCGAISAERALNYGFTGPNLQCGGRRL